MTSTKIETQGLGMPWEDEYGYAQGVKKGDTVWIAGQVGHDEHGILGAGMETQLLYSYANIKALLEGFNMTMDHVVEEVLYVTDMAAAFEARKKYKQTLYFNPKAVASTIVVVAGLAIPGQLIEIKVVDKE